MINLTDIDKLIATGLTKYETLAYLALLDKNCTTALDISERACIPKQRIYDTLDSLQTKGLCTIREERPRCYIAHQPAEALMALFSYKKRQQAIENRRQFQLIQEMICTLTTLLDEESSKSPALFQSNDDGEYDNIGNDFKMGLNGTIPKTTANEMSSKQMVLYTRNGDEGYTGLLGPNRAPKYDLRLETCGAVDEANSFLGLVRAEPAVSERTKKLILAVQHDLSLLMSELVCLPGVQLPIRFGADRVKWLEAEIDKLSLQIPSLNQFVVPGDTIVGARLDVARSTVRRAERYACRLLHEEQIENSEIFPFLNRLSSLLFGLALYEEHRVGCNPTLVKGVKCGK
jgi:cob(I)alamin adenosyltransferase